MLTLSAVYQLSQPAALGVCLTCLFTLLDFPVKQNVSRRFHLEHGAT